MLLFILFSLIFLALFLSVIVSDDKASNEIIYHVKFNEVEISEVFKNDRYTRRYLIQYLDINSETTKDLTDLQAKDACDSIGRMVAHDLYKSIRGKNE